jgi:hypothetical protein
MSLLSLPVALLIAILVFAGNMFWGNTDWAVLAALNVFVVLGGLLAALELNLRIFIGGILRLFRREWVLGFGTLLLWPVANALLVVAFITGSYVAERLNLHQFEGSITIQDHLSGEVAALNSLRLLPVIVVALAMLPFLQRIGRRKG